MDKDKRGILNEADVVKHVDKTQGLRFSSYRRMGPRAGGGGSANSSPGLTVGAGRPVT